MSTVRDKCQKLWNWILEDPKYIVRIIVLFVCTICVIFQISECFYKLQHPPITTHSHFDINDTLTYPAITFCRDPPYKQDIVQKYNLQLHPLYTSEWKYFPFHNSSLEDFFHEATYNVTEFFALQSLGLNSSPDNIEIQSTLHFNLGLCYTLKPLKTVQGSWKNSGYVIMLRHEYSSIEESPASELTPGWHVYIHEPNEIFSEDSMQISGRVENLYVTSNEDIELKLTAQHFYMLEGRDNNCTNDLKLSTSKCSQICYWKRVTDQIGCTGPWMPNIQLPMCDNVNDTVNLIKLYRSLKETEEKDENCICEEPCNSIIYSSFVMNRRYLANCPDPMTRMHIYFTSKLVSIIEERPNYDFSQFVADMGGSLGFLLGLSVLGLIGIMENITVLLVGKFCPRTKILVDRKQSTTDITSVANSDTTIDIQYAAKSNQEAKEQNSKF